MSPRLHSRFSGLAGLLLSAVLSAGAQESNATAPPAPPTPASVAASTARRSDRIVQRIDALLKHRLKPEAPLVNPSNPFRVVKNSAAARIGEDAGTDIHPEEELDKTADASGGQTPGEESVDGAKALAHYVGGLKIGGVIRLKDQVVQIVINGVPRKEGDFIILEQDNAVIHLQLVRIMSGAIVVRLNGTEQTFKF
jgi:hypothetical protein